MSDTWAINYIPEEGGRLTGKLTVGDEEVRFQALYDSSTANVVKGIGKAIAGFAATGGHATVLHNSDSEVEVVIPRSSISRAEARKKGMMKQAVIVLEDGQELVFDYGLLSVKNLVAALNGE